LSIEFHCESCGRLVKAPQDAAGKRGQCPYCSKNVYIPMPEGELEELPLAPDDEGDRRREEALQAERRRLDRILAQQKETPEGEPAPSARHSDAPHTPQPATISLEEAVLAYLDAMRKSDLARADHLLAALQRRSSEARAVVDRLATDQIPPSSMRGVPPAVYQGFLKSLHAQL
jgi:hypothetical protein